MSSVSPASLSLLTASLQTASIQESIADFDANVTAIADLNARSLNALSEEDSAANHARLAELTESTRALSSALSNRLKALKVQPSGAGPQDAEIRKNRVCLRLMNRTGATEPQPVIDHATTWKIRRDSSEVPDRRTTISPKVQGPCGTAVQDW